MSPGTGFHSVGGTWYALTKMVSWFTFPASKFLISLSAAMLPNSFRLSKADQHFELATSCQREQDVWLNCIREALSHVPAWVAEPLPSFMSDVTGDGKCDHLVMSVSTHSASTSEDGHVPTELVVVSDQT